MSSLLFLAMLIGVAWLCVWSVLLQPWKGGWWWPFDMRGDSNEAAADPERGFRRGRSVARNVGRRTGIGDRQSP